MGSTSHSKPQIWTKGGIFERGGISPQHELNGFRRPPTYKYSGNLGMYKNQLKGFYPEDRQRPLIIILTAFSKKKKPYGRVLRNLLKAVKNDFGFDGRYIDFSVWARNGIRFIHPKYPAHARKIVRSFNRSRPGRVLIITIPGYHINGLWVDPGRHLVMYTKELSADGWADTKVFRAAVDYLNIDPNIFRPE